MNLYWINNFRIDVLLNDVLRDLMNILFDVISIVTFQLTTKNKMADVRYKEYKTPCKRRQICHLAFGVVGDGHIIIYGEIIFDVFIYSTFYCLKLTA